MIHEKEKTASVRIVEFIGGFYGRLIDNQGTVSFVQFVEIAAQVLRLEPDALRAKKRLLGSSSNFDRSHATKVRIPLARREGFSVPKEQEIDASLYRFG